MPFGSIPFVSMLGLLEAGAGLHRFYLFAVVVAKGLTA